MVVYKITNMLNGMVYIGCTTDFENRMRTHKRLGFGKLKARDFDYRDAKTGRLHIGSLRKHSGLYLDMRESGNINDFMFEIIENCDSKEQMYERENFYILKYWGNNCYNDLYTDNNGKTHSRRTRMTRHKWGVYKKIENENEV